MHLDDCMPYALLTTCGMPCSAHSLATSTSLECDAGPRFGAACQGGRASGRQGRRGVPVRDARRKARGGGHDRGDARGAVRGDELGDPPDVGPDLVGLDAVRDDHHLVA